MHMQRCMCRPFDVQKVSKTSGAWHWVGVPQSTLLNGHGYYGDCAVLSGSEAGAVDPPVCNATLHYVPPGRSSVMPWQAPDNPGTPHPALGRISVGYLRPQN